MEATFTIKSVRGGFPCELTLVDTDTKALMARALAALDWLVAQGFEPPAAQGQAAPPPAKAAPALPDGTPDPAWCPIHGVTMARREKDGQVWYSHKLPDGTYCRGKKKGEATHEEAKSGAYRA